MKGKRYTEEQIVHILKDVERGKSIVAVAREYGVSETTIHRWRGKYRGMDQASLRRLKELEAENTRLKSIVARLCRGQRTCCEISWEKNCESPSEAAGHEGRRERSRHRRAPRMSARGARPIDSALRTGAEARRPGDRLAD